VHAFFGTVPLAIWLVLGACVVAVLTDLRSRRIPNGLTIALAIAGLALHATQGWVALGLTVMTLVCALGVGSIAFGFGWLGGGDVKLLAAGAATLGFPDAIPFVIYTALAGGVIAFAVAFGTGRLRAVLASVVALMRPFVFKGTAAVAPANPVMFPYAIAIASGAVAVALSHTLAGSTLKLGL
jgi:prepilin peptidase CpaA